MWFDLSMDEAYQNGIQPAIEDAGYEAVRIDRKDHNNKIDDEIIAEIRRSRFLVADFTQITKPASLTVSTYLSYSHVGAMSSVGFILTPGNIITSLGRTQRNLENTLPSVYQRRSAMVR